MGAPIVGSLAAQAVAAGATQWSYLDGCAVVLVDAVRAVAAVRAWIEPNFPPA